MVTKKALYLHVIWVHAPEEGRQSMHNDNTDFYKALQKHTVIINKNYYFIIRDFNSKWAINQALVFR
jgi:hypothetical protein